MARKPRVEFPGGFYHVIARGNRRATLFHDDADYEAYLERLERYRRRDGLRCYAYVLMPNHVHLLVETGVVPLSAGKGAFCFSDSATRGAGPINPIELTPTLSTPPG